MKSTPHPVRPTCPRCRSALLRTQRSFFDRVISLAVPVRRYSCASGGCGWQGLIRRPAAFPVEGVWDNPGVRDQVIEASRMPRGGFGSAPRPGGD